MANVYYVSGRVQYKVGAHMQAASKEEALTDFMAMVEMDAHERLRPDDDIADFDWSDIQVTLK